MLKILKNIFGSPVEYILDNNREFNFAGKHYVPFDSPYTESGKSYLGSTINEYGEVIPEKVYQKYISVSDAKNRKEFIVEVDVAEEIMEVLIMKHRLQAIIDDIEFDIETIKFTDKESFFIDKIAEMKNNIINIKGTIEYLNKELRLDAPGLLGNAVKLYKN